jgi:hypothetical protein
MRTTTRFGAALVFVILTSVSGAGRQASVDASAARAAFEQFKLLAGDWDARSTAGWGGVKQVMVIARSSAVLSTSTHGAHPGDDESMATVYHLDGNRLLLTHYCVARNQPRLVATKIENGGRRIEFTFLDGTNLPTRNTGHMDRAVFEFHDHSRFTSRWTWYQDGQEKWMEEIVYTRRH